MVNDCVPTQGKCCYDVLMHRLRAIPKSLIIVCALLLLGGYQIYTTYSRAQIVADAEAKKVLRIEENQRSIKQALSDVPGISASDLSNGFWFTFTDANGEYVYYVDPAALAAQGLSDEQIHDLITRLRTSVITSKTTTRDLSNAELSPILQFHNKLYSFDQSGSFIATEQNLKRRVQSASSSSDDLLKLSYVSELTGDYAARDVLDARNCKDFKKRCLSNRIQIHISGHVLDTSGTPLEGVQVNALSRPDVAPVSTDVHGAYTITLAVNDLEKVRLHIVKRNFSDGIASIVIVSRLRTSYETADTTLSSPITIVTIDTDKKTVTGELNAANPDGSFVIHTKQSTYQIPSGAFFHADGKPYQGKLDVYLYEFARGSVPESLTTVDTFDQVVGYAGDLMKSFGMPYIQFFAPSGEEIHVFRSKPMILTYRIANMDDLRSNAAHIYRALTDDDIQLLIAASVGQPYRIDRTFLIDHQLLQFPAFWVFDRRAGIWQNVGISVLDGEGTVRSKFYTINDAPGL